ncbi:TrmH family RNA methyltransferase [Singulisphaera acidiphila]|uniref:rRNA methylase n=1 Tax=Singulisphaera acidiphila (strain ATCC BAA-1392 / DSM 18658 / VKM B-2454 / MOB10) TaxID=886293 RepID=L0DM34_SINAD|nr:RNA methyltransferase [Singulisphaera acidiphila]AGA29751.1 rRNA methylase [Singulisphaera acidiphila DSM 18658]
MPQVLIDNLDDPRIAKYRHLKRTNQTRDDDQFVVEGEKLLERLVESVFPLASVLATERHAPRVEAIIPSDIPFYVVSPDLISVIVGFNFHRGVLACGYRRPWPDLADLVGRAERSTIVVCPELNNPENLGTIVRIGDVFGVDAVLVGGSCPDPLSRRVLRVSMGTSLRLPVIVREDLDTELNRLRSDWGFELMATVVDPRAEPFESVPRPERLALFMGSESEGLDPHWIHQCQRQVTIPMRQDAESLNVAVAAGIFLYHFSLTKGGVSLTGGTPKPQR